MYNNNFFLWYITANIRSFPRFNFLCVAPGTLFCTNTKNLWCDSTFNKTKNLGARKWIFLMPQMTVTISDVFAFTYKLIPIKWTNIVITVIVLSPKYVLSNSYFVFRYSMKYYFDNNVDLFPMITIWMIFCVFVNVGNNTYHPSSYFKISVDVYFSFLSWITYCVTQAYQKNLINTLWIISINILFFFSLIILWTPYLKRLWDRYWE